MMRFENYRDVCKVVGNKSTETTTTLHYEWRLKILRWHDGMYTKARLCQKFDEQYGSRSSVADLCQQAPHDFSSTILSQLIDEMTVTVVCSMIIVNRYI